MCFELRTYTLRPGCTDAYLAHFETVGLPIISRYASLIGYWRAEDGTLNQVLHLWAYASREDRVRKRAALYADAEWAESFLPRAMEMLLIQESRILVAVPFSPLQAVPSR